MADNRGNTDDDDDESAGGKILSPLRILVPGPIRRRYALKFGIAILAVALLIGVIGAGASTAFSTLTQENAGENYAATAHQEAETVDAWLQQRQVITDVVAESRAVNMDEIDPAEMGQLITRVRGDNEYITAIHVVDESGAVLESSSPTARGSEFSAEGTPWVEGIGTVGRSVQQSSVYQAEDTKLTAFVRQVSEHDDRWVVLLYDMELFSESFSGRFMPGDSFTVLVDDESRIVGHGTDSTQLLTEYNRDSLLTPARDLSPGGREFEESVSPIDGLTDEDTVVGYSKVPDSEWVVLVHGPTDDAYGFAERVRNQGIAATMVGVVLIGVVGLVLGRNTAVSVKRLTSKASEIEDGNLDVKVKSIRDDEIGTLYGTFDTMRLALKDRIQEVQVARQEAEKQREQAEQQREQLQAAADRYEVTMEQCADGDLTQRLDPDENNESMGKIAEDFNYMIDQIDGTIAQVKQFSTKVSDTSEIVLGSTSELEEASGQIAESAQVISEETNEVQEDLATVSTQLDDCLDRLESGDRDAVTELETISDSLADLAERTNEALMESKNIAAATEEQTAALSEVTETARDLDRSAGPLADLLDNFESSERLAFNFDDTATADRREDE